MSNLFSQKSIQSSASLRSWFLILAVILTLIDVRTTQAVDFPDGSKAFESAVLLLNSYSTFNGVRARQAIYYFDLELPKDAGESLKRIMFKQRGGGDEIEFKSERTKVYLGDHNNKQEQLNVTANYNEDSGMMEVKLDQPIPPGSNFTVGLKPTRNPDYAGVYLFGVTVFPSGETPRGLYLGAGRLHFYRSDDFNF